MTRKKQALSGTVSITLGFFAIIVLGALILCLPVATRDGSISFLDALFTATSAACVTGLVVVDTYQKFTLFGQIIILLLIQIGGLGFMTIGVYISILLKKKIGLQERETLHESVSTLEVAGVVRLVKTIVRGTAISEIAGALILSWRFIPQFGIWRGLYFGIFHSVSAFCNAGFDLMGINQEYSSLVSYEGDPVVSITIMVLIVVGGIGFIVWDDIKRNKLNFRKYLLHSKIVITATFFLIVVGAGLFFLFEYNKVLADMCVGDQLLGAFFCSVTPRTAGFNTVDVASLSGASKLLTMFLMFVGGSSGSTAGGIKTTTFVVLVFAAKSMITREPGMNLFNRRLDDEMVKKASTVAVINLGLVLIASFIILGVQTLPFEDVLLEVFSAIGTVGLSTGITRELLSISKMALIILMYSGRLGSLTFALTFAQGKIIPPVSLPMEKIVVG